MSKVIYRWAYAIVFTATTVIACGPSTQTSQLNEDPPPAAEANSEGPALCAAKGIPSSIQTRVEGNGLNWITFKKQKEGATASECVVLYVGEVAGKTKLLANYYTVIDGVATLSKSTGAGLTKSEIAPPGDKTSTANERTFWTEDCPTEC